MKPGLLLLLAACRSPTPGPQSSTLLLDAEQQHLWVSSPDEDAVVELDLDTLLETRRVSVPGAPQQLLRLEDTLLVSLGRANRLALLDLSVAQVTAEIELPCAAGAMAAHETEGRLWVALACPQRARVVLLPLDDPDDQRVLRVDGAPLALAVSGETLLLTDGRGARLLRYPLAPLQGPSPDDPWDPLVLEPEASPLEDREDRAASQPRALAIDPRSGEPVVAYQRVDHDSDRDRPASEGGYGSVIDGDPRIEPRLWGPCGQAYAQFDGGARVHSGPSALVVAGDLVWVAHQYTDTVAVLRCTDSEELLPMVAAFRVGAGPRGLVVAEDGRTAYVDLGFDHAVARLSVSKAQVRAASALLYDAELIQRRETEIASWSSEALRGRRLFHDATDTHLTPSGIVTCATCHPDGGADSLSWFLHTEGIPRKVRRTPPAWAVDPEARPLHWDGAFDDAEELVRSTVLELMGGDALLVDTAAIAAYMAENPPPLPISLSVDQAAQAAEGELVFEAAGCGVCHTGPSYTDGLAHAVIPPSNDPDASLDEAFTPSLLGLGAHPPYLHDGRAQTLTALLTQHNPDDQHGQTSTLSDEERAALTQFLESL